MPQPPFSLLCNNPPPLPLPAPPPRPPPPPRRPQRQDYAALPAFHTPTFTFVDPTGQVSKGSAAAVAAMTADLAVLDDFFYEVTACTGAPTGERTYRFVGVARMFADLPGGEGGGEGKAGVEYTGREWDCVGGGVSV
ncbi:hypothetical protein B0T18DRAFT_430349 [Schizothecium vesticola]|uniref:Uncharacterized protein n=1 Tax=Schizothecium vesticola TaxID=314040 RepID=A0AA40K236_9PEZI|nr:hypothetical protein B0T18DRAFT_430349 [Schizothecium vesticola]